MRTIAPIVIGLLCAFVGIGAIPRGRPAPPAGTLPRDASVSRPGHVQVQMRNVNLHVDRTILLKIRSLRGHMISRRAGAFPVFDDKRSYILHIDRGEVEIGAESLTDLMNRYVLAYHGAPLEHVRITIEDGRVKQEGKLRKGPGIPFSIVSEVDAAPDGRIRLHPTSMKAAGIPAKGILKVFGLKLGSLARFDPERGIETNGNDLLLDPRRLFPPPEMDGRVTKVEAREGALVQTFGGEAAEPLAPPLPDANYIYFRGGMIRFGKLIMTDADLQMIDEDPRDPFDFYPDRYNDQLVAGYSKNRPNGGLKTFMPDYDQVKEHLAQR